MNLPIAPEVAASPETLPALPTAFATECDLVMKGGITSGVVYPLAIAEISKAFRLRNIGGTSAGAIAAAAAAAAELGRQRHLGGNIRDDPDGFGEIEKLPAHLCAESQDKRGTKLLAFFKPKAELRPIFKLLTGMLAVKGGGARAMALITGAVAQYKLAAFAGLFVGSVPLWFLPFDRSTLPAWIWTAVFALLLAVALAARQALRAVGTGLPRHYFGICSGMPGKDDEAPDEALTEWLSRYFDRLSGQEQAYPDQRKPLTFGDLKKHGINLEVMTTCLTMWRPFRLPFRDDQHVRENNVFLFKETEFRELFPEHVVRWMVDHPRPQRSAEESKSRFSQLDFTGFSLLPVPDDLPVIVAVRMSLSFPVLLSAIPLYSVDFRKAPPPPEEKEKPERCWFTDGGIGSNFPIHFFDAPLPTRPTFGLDLGSTEDAEAQRVVFPEKNNDALLPYWRRFRDQDGFGAILGFLGSVVSVAKDWNHETLSHMPGFRDRIGLIRLTKEEGGLNLTMPAERIARLSDYGRQAGLQFVRRFGDPARWAPGMQPTAMNWENHQLIRLRLLLASLSEVMANLETASTALAADPPQDYKRFFSTDSGPRAYRLAGQEKLDTDPATGLHVSQAGLAKWIFEMLLDVARRLARTVASAPPSGRIHPGQGAPKPTPELKPRPRI